MSMSEMSQRLEASMGSAKSAAATTRPPKPAAAAAPPAPALAATGSFTLADGRKVEVLADRTAVVNAVAAQVESAAKAAIQEKQAFSVCVPGGFGPADGVKYGAASCVAEAMSLLAGRAELDFSKFHVFFSGERLDVQESYQRARKQWIDACKVPLEQVHAVAPGPPEGAAAQYTATICMQEENVIADSPSGLPCVDLMLLEVAKDGAVGRIRPGSAEAKRAGDENVVLPIEEMGNESLALSLDFMSASPIAVIVSVAGDDAGEELPAVVANALDRPSPGAPAGLVRGRETLWLTDTRAASAASLSA